jgi:DNA-directed RNA polymerase subunit RPC12/RpoP
MLTESVYVTTCSNCGAKIITAREETTCAQCGLEILIEWQWRGEVHK